MRPTWHWYALAGGGLTVVLLAVGLWLLLSGPVDEVPPTPMADPTEAPVAEVEPEPEFPEVLGQSVEGRDIIRYSFGAGDTHVLLVGGIHGGYEWNSILLAYQMIDHLEANPDFVPDRLTVDIIPDLNPDGTFAATGLTGRFSATEITDYSMHQTGAGRFNANGVDLNRNFGCDWAPESTWRGQVVSAGSEPFSEPEAKLLRDLVLETQPIAAAFWHSQANNVYASECEDGPLPLTLDIMNSYAAAANYGAVPVFDAYPITGDVEGWLASIGIAAVTVELQGRLTPEWERNLAGTQAMLETIAAHVAATQ